MKPIACTTLVTLLAITLGGCGRSLSPELRGLALTKHEAHNNYRVTANQNKRSASDDLARLFCTDNPSRLTPYPVVNTGGLPK